MASDTQGALAPLMDVRSVVKRYGTHEVLHDVSLNVSRGETVSVIGENGAGKSTLAKLMAGVTRPDEGELRFNGRPVSFSSPRDALQAGIGFIPQELAYWPDLSVGENVLVGAWPSKRGVVSPRELQKRALELSERFGIPLDLARPMRALKLGERQLVEILKALSRDATALILDEPTAALTEPKAATFSRCSASSPRRGTALCTSRTAWTRCFGSPTASTCSATAAWWHPPQRTTRPPR